MCRVHSGPQHEAMQCHSMRFPCGTRTSGDPRRGGSPERGLGTTKCFTCSLGRNTRRCIATAYETHAARAPHGCKIFDLRLKNTSGHVEKSLTILGRQIVNLGHACIAERAGGPICDGHRRTKGGGQRLRGLPRRICEDACPNYVERGSSVRGRGKVC